MSGTAITRTAPGTAIIRTLVPGSVTSSDLAEGLAAEEARADGAYGPGGTAGNVALTIIKPSGDTTGATDLANMNAAITAARSAGDKSVYCEPGDYYFNNRIVVDPLNGATGNVPAPVPGIVGSFGVGAGRISDEADTAPIRFIAASTFPVGTFLLDYVQSGVPYAGTGYRITGITFECDHKAAGVRLQGPRCAKVDGVTIVNPAAPVSPGDGANGGFSVTAITGGGSAGAYNEFRQIIVWGAHADAFWDNTNFQNDYYNCVAGLPTGACYHAAGANGSACASSYTNCHYAGGTYAAQLDHVSSASFINLSPYPGNPWPSKNAVLIENGWQYNVAGFYPPQFIGCRLINNPAAGVTAADGAVVRVKANSTYQTSALFTGGVLGAQTHTSHFVYTDSGIPAGGLVTFRDVLTTGTPTVSTYLDQSSLLQFFNCTGIADNKSPIIMGRAAAASNSSNLTSTAADVGVSATFTAPSAGKLLVQAMFDMSVGSNADIIVGSLVVDGTTQTDEVVASGSESRIPMSCSWVVSLAAGSHTIKLQAARVSGAGTDFTNGTHTKLTYQFVPNAN